MAVNLASPASSRVLSHPAALRVDPAAEAAYLRALIERQPSPLMRVALDGTLLAVSDAALGLLAGKDLAQVLGSSLLERLAPEHAQLWRDFASRVWQQGSASLECSLVDFTDVPRTVQLQGVALTDHPDGLESMLLSARDVSAVRRLESTLAEQESHRRVIAEQKAKLAEAVAAQQRLESLAADRESQVQRLIQEQANERTALQQSLSDAHQLQLMQQERQMQQTVAALKAEVEQESSERQALQKMLEQSVAEREAFETALREREAKRQKLVADHATARIRAEQALGDAQAQLEQVTRALNALLDAAGAARQVMASSHHQSTGRAETPSQASIRISAPSVPVAGAAVAPLINFDSLDAPATAEPEAPRTAKTDSPFA
jgi:hypothetical protein